MIPFLIFFIGRLYFQFTAKKICRYPAKMENFVGMIVISTKKVQ